MKIETVKTNSAFSSAPVPSGKVLVFYVSDGNGGYVKRYKDQNGNFIDM